MYPGRSINEGKLIDQLIVADGGDFRGPCRAAWRIGHDTGSEVECPRTNFALYGRLPYIEDMEKVSTIARLEARLPADVHALLKRAAEIQGRTLTAFVVAAAREAACRTIEESEIIRLSVQDQRQIAEAILKPPSPAPALKRAFKRRRELFGPA
jgi:uncharacterized protein (DUF1778 family)